MITLNLEKLITIRPGLYDEVTMHLSNTGKRQMKFLLRPLRRHILLKSNVVLLSSCSEQAKESVKILSDELGISYELTPLLWSDVNHKQDDVRAIDFIKRRAMIINADIIIIVTELEYSQSLPRKMAEEAGQTFPWSSLFVNEGEMQILDFSKMACLLY